MDSRRFGGSPKRRLLTTAIHMYIGYIGFGKMGKNMALRLKERGHSVIGYNRGEEGRETARKEGIEMKNSILELVRSLPAPRVMWLMVSHAGVDEVLQELSGCLEKGDFIIEGGNSYFKESIRRGVEAKTRGFRFLDVGVSGGPKGAREGACVMVGGDRPDFEACRVLFEDIAVSGGARYMGSHGAGHFVKMVHNGIEYGMMQAIGEGFALLKASPFSLDLAEVADLYQHKSVIESRLVGWLLSGFKMYGVGLDSISGSVSHSGEGAWTVQTAKEVGIPTPVIEDSLNFRIASQAEPSYIGKVVSVIRNQFGGHEVKEKE